MNPLSSAIYSGLFGDAEISGLFSDRATIRALMLVEAALAEAQGALNLIPKESAAAIARAAREAEVDPNALTEGTARDGVMVPAFVEAFRSAMHAPEHAQFVHFGATSQDILDTGLALRMKRVVALLDTRLFAVICAFGKQADAHRDTIMAARSRQQVATPTTLGARIAQWTDPLIRHRDRLTELRPRLLQVSVHGASGTSAAYGVHASALRAAMADALCLGHSAISPHAARDAVVEFGNWLAMLSGSLGKIGCDLILLSQTEVAEVRAGAAGGSSTMPHKTNPTLAEGLITLAAYARGQAATLATAMDTAHERDGSAWALEWLTLPDLCVATGAALTKASKVAQTLTADRTAMQSTIAATNGLMMAEAATFALAGQMPRPEATALVKAACKRTVETGEHLSQSLAALEAPTLDWDSVLAPDAYIGDAHAQVDALIELIARQGKPG